MHRNLSPAGVLIFVARFNFAFLPSTWFRLSGGSRVLFVRLARRALLLFRARIFVHAVYYELRSLRAPTRSFSVIYAANVNLANIRRFLFFFSTAVGEWTIEILTTDYNPFFWRISLLLLKSEIRREKKRWTIADVQSDSIEFFSVCFGVFKWL